MAVGIETGARISEILSLRDSSLEMPRTVIIEQSKTGTVRRARVSPLVFEYLCSLSLESEVLFEGMDYKMIYRFLLNHYPSAMLERTKQRSTVTHILRKIAVRIAWDKGLTVADIQRVFGWESTGSVLYYL